MFGQTKTQEVHAAATAAAAGAGAAAGAVPTKMHTFKGRNYSRPPAHYVLTR